MDGANPRPHSFVPSAVVSTFWRDCSRRDKKDLSGGSVSDMEMILERRYQMFDILKNSAIFINTFCAFADNILCVKVTDAEKRIHINEEMAEAITNEAYHIPGKVKKYVGCWFTFIHDDSGAEFNIVYECDDINDPATGMFFQTEHVNDCRGRSCSWQGCDYNYHRDDNNGNISDDGTEDAEDNCCDNNNDDQWPLEY